jgi:hypothetical protein
LFQAFPIEKFTSNPNTVLIKTQQGGHISFAEGLMPFGCNYACRLLSDYLEDVVKDIAVKHAYSKNYQKREINIESSDLKV